MSFEKKFRVYKERDGEIIECDFFYGKDFDCTAQRAVMTEKELFGYKGIITLEDVATGERKAFSIMDLVNRKGF